ncbi:phosphate ABC transporter substrate-binding protein PstS [Winogradskya humida]|uniref:Phosphate-binding protein n=2 Tax=Winogradskya humida TaxID=113566 RepID=A0ABQ3ZUP1_9ACTN|nr:phosphate ABC transporter substrate-binding protein PstS [Actinoplanes humidus]GIE22305.1 phosphate-binding protein PstS [Actinoplanes humidus]
MKVAATGVAVVLALGGCAAVGGAVVGEGAADESRVQIECGAGAVAGSGSSAQASVVNTWIKVYQAACGEATVGYDSVGSGAGVAAFLAGKADFAGSDSPLSAAEQQRATERCHGVPAVHLPMVVGPVALAYNVAGVSELRLRPATIARIFAGTITVWNDPVIVAENPGSTLPATRIQTVHRADSSGTTDNFTAFLAAAAGKDWRYGRGGKWLAPGGTAARGSNRVATAIARADGAIGYVERSYATFHHLGAARVGNSSGEFVALTDDAVATTVAGAGNDDLRLGIDYATASAGAYPIVLVTYEIICGSGHQPDRLGVLKGFLGYTASADGQRDAAGAGYVPLPEEVRAQVATAAAALT